MKRLGIFVFYDKDGIVDDYVVYLLKNIKDHLDDLLIVCNGALSEKGRERLSAFTDRIYERDNTGFDAMAYKLGMTDYAGWDEIVKYDEVLLFNDTFFGPLYPFSEVFDKMDHTPCDFWGLTCHAKAFDYVYSTEDAFPAHIQSYFSVYRKPVLESAAFQDYWNRFDSTHWYYSDVTLHEQFFTKYLEDAGFTWEAYVNASKYNSTDPKKNYNHYYYLAHELIRDYRCPIIKRKNLEIKHLNKLGGNMGADNADAIRFIQQHTDYDVNMIWDNIIRVYDINKIKNALHLDYVLPWEQTYVNNYASKHKGTAVIAYLSDEKMLSVCLIYLKQIPEDIDLYIATPNEEIEKELQDICIDQHQWHIIHVSDRGREIGALWVACNDIVKKYEYLCFVHDVRRTVSMDGPNTIGNAFFYNMWENTLKSADYIENILSLFETNSRLGFLAPPQPIHADFFGSIGAEWYQNYQNTLDLADKLGIHAKFSPDIPCFAFNNVFWCRTKALKPLYDHKFTYEELPEGPIPLDGTINHAIERIYPYAAQSEGYYSGIVMNNDYASLQNTNLYFYLSKMLDQVRAKYEITDFDSIVQQEILSYCKGKQNIFIYGAGSNGITISNNLKNNNIMIKGFIISDDQPKQNEKNGFPIFRLSDVPYEKEEICIVVSVGYARDRIEVLGNLSRKGYNEFYLLP